VKPSLLLVIQLTFGIFFTSNYLILTNLIAFMLSLIVLPKWEELV